MARKQTYKAPATNPEAPIVEGEEVIEQLTEESTEGTNVDGDVETEEVSTESADEDAEDQGEEVDTDTEEEIQDDVQETDVDADVLTEGPIFGDSADASTPETEPTPTITEEVAEEVEVEEVVAPTRVIELDTVTLPAKNDELVVGNCELWKGSIRSFGGYKSAANIVSILMKNDKVKCIVHEKSFFDHIVSKFKQVASRVSLRS